MSHNHMQGKFKIQSSKSKVKARKGIAVLGILGLALMLVAPVTVNAVGPSANLDQGKNGTAGSPISPVDWVNGNLNSSHSHYVEGQSVAYRTILENLTSGNTYTLAVGFDIRNSGKHAIDFLTRNNRIAETVNPCAGVSPCVAGTSIDIPTPPAGTPNTQTYFNNLESNEGNQQISVFNGTGVSATYNQSGNESTGSASEAIVYMTFTASDSTSVLSWGGHIGREFDWGLGQGATGISGSPYHMRVKGFCSGNVLTCTSGGNQDRSLSASAVEIGNLTVIKHVINDNGGTAVASDFTMNVTGNQVSPSSFPGSEAGTSVSLALGGYNVTETGPSGYTATYSDECSGEIVVEMFPLPVCTITNNDDPTEPTDGTLTVTKVVINDNGGTAVVSDFTLFVSDTSELPGVTIVTSGASNSFPPDEYVVTETNLEGYTPTFSGDCYPSGILTIEAGESYECTITNDDIAPTLTVTKIVNNDDGGTLEASDFDLFIDAAEVVNGQPNTLTAGVTYTVSENQVAGYAGTVGGDCASDGTITLAPGDEKTCIITNNDIAPGLTVIKTVVNDNGGTMEASEFNLYIDGNPVTSGASNELPAGIYQVSEDEVPGYSGSFDGDCDSEGSVTLGVGETKICYIVNNDIGPTLTVIKTVVNDNGGNASATDFTMLVTGTNVSSTSFEGSDTGTVVTLDAGSYSVDEIEIEGYTKSLGANCEGQIGVGETVTCTITNDDQAGSLIVRKIVQGGEAGADDFSFVIGESDPIQWEVDGENEFSINAGIYAVIETGIAPGYNLTNVECIYDEDSVGEQVTNGKLVTIANGDTVICSFTNTYRQPDEPEADLEMDKSVEPSSVEVGDQVTFTLSVYNNGPDDATGVVATDALPSGLSYVSDNGGGAYDANTNEWTIGNLDYDDTVTLQIVATVTATDGEVINIANVSIDPEISDVTDPNTENNEDDAIVTIAGEPEGCQENCEPTPPPSPSPTPTPPPGGGGGGSVVINFNPPTSPAPSPSPTPEPTPSPTPVPQVLGETLPRTGAGTGISIDMGAIVGLVLIVVGFALTAKQERRAGFVKYIV